MSGVSYNHQAFLTAQAMASSFNSSALLVYQCRESSIQLVFSGSAPTGTFKLQSSDDLTFTAADVSNWTDVAGSSQAIVEGGVHQWKILNRYKWLRVVWTAVSGAGACTGIIFAAEEA